MFKSFTVYQLDADIDLSSETIGNAIAQFANTDIPQGVTSVNCWVPPLGKKTSDLLHVVNDNIRLRMQKSIRLMPTAVIKQRTEERCELVLSQNPAEYDKGYLPSTVKNELKQIVINEMLKTAFVQKSWQDLILLPKAGLVIVEGASEKRCEELLSFLRKCLGSLPVKLLRTDTSPSSAFAEWFSDSANIPIGFSLGEDFELVASLDNKNKATFKQQDVLSDEVTAALSCEKWPTKISLGWREKFTFTVNESLQIQSLKATDIYKDSIDDHSDALAQLDAEFAMFTGEISQLMSELTQAIGMNEEGAEPEIGFGNVA